MFIQLQYGEQCTVNSEAVDKVGELRVARCANAEWRSGVDQATISIVAAN